MCFHIFYSNSTQGWASLPCFKASPETLRGLQWLSICLDRLQQRDVQGLLGTAVPNQTYKLSYRCTAYSIPRPGNAVLQPCCRGLDLKRCALRSEALCLEIRSSHIPLLTQQPKHGHAFGNRSRGALEGVHPGTPHAGWNEGKVCSKSSLLY